LLAALTSGQLTSLLGVANAGQLTSLLGVADAGELTSLLGAANPTALSGALGGLDAGSLTAILSQLTPAQIATLLALGTSPTSVITGLDGILGGLGVNPSAGAVDALLGQLDGLLAGGLPIDATQLGQLSSLLGGITPLLSTNGLDTSLLTTLLGTLDTGLVGAPAGSNTSAVFGFAKTVAGVLPHSTGGTGSGGTGSGGTGSSGGSGGTGTTGRSGHATIARVQRKGNVISVTLHCSASSNMTCTATVKATQHGKQKSHTYVTLRGGTSKVVKLRPGKAAIKTMLRRHRAVAMQITALTGSYRTTKTLR
jgi:hypothetical protein